MRQIVSSAALVAAFLAPLVPAVAAAAPGFDLQVGAFVDDQDGISYDLNARFRPSDSLTLSLGAGRSSSSLATTEFNGTSVHGGADLRRGRFGVGLSASNWEDSDQFGSQVLGGRFSVTFAESFDVALVAESRQLDVTYTTTGLLGRTVAQDVRFDGVGLGAELGWAGNAWGGYLRGMSYGYGGDIDRLRAAAQSPNLLSFPRLAALVGSMATLTRGALDSQLATGVEYSFTRVTLHADLMQVKDAITSANADSWSIGALVMLNGRFSIDVGGGVSGGDGYENTGFGTITLGAHW